VSKSKKRIIMLDYAANAANATIAVRGLINRIIDVYQCKGLHYNWGIFIYLNKYKYKKI
jgi:hypothetical protein